MINILERFKFNEQNWKLLCNNDNSNDKFQSNANIIYIA